MARAREALEWIRVGSASPMETRSRVLFGRVGLPEPELNAGIHDPDGGWLATGDLVWRRAVEEAGWTYVDLTKDDYFRRPRRLELVRRLAEVLRCELDPAGMATIDAAPGMPGGPIRACGG